MRISVTELPAVTKYEVALGISTGLWVWRRVGFLGRNGVLAPYPLREGGVRALGSQALRRIRLLTRLWHDVHLLQPVCAPAGCRRKASTAAAASRAVMTTHAAPSWSDEPRSTSSGVAVTTCSTRDRPKNHADQAWFHAAARGGCSARTWWSRSTSKRICTDSSAAHRSGRDQIQPILRAVAAASWRLAAPSLATALER